MLRDEVGDDAERRGATPIVAARNLLPLAAMNDETGGHQVAASETSCTIDGGDPASGQVHTHCALPVPATIQLGEEGHGLHADQGFPAPRSGTRAEEEPLTSSPLPDPTLIDFLIAAQRKRRFCIVSQSRCDRACEAFIARTMGYRTDLPDAERKALFAKATALRRAVEREGGGHSLGDDHIANASPDLLDIIRGNAMARKVWDETRKQTEIAMQKAVRALPVWSWAAGVRGFGALGVAIVIGETGDLANYATKERVWKRLGLAVIDGERQQRKSGAEAAKAHGYSPKRRAEIWTIADGLFKHQWRGQKDDRPPHAIGPYGEVYGRRKAHTVTREWTPKHRDNDARRVMTKALIEDMWRVWRGSPPVQTTKPEDAP